MSELDTTTDITTLLEAGRRAIAHGDTFEARSYFRRVTEIDEQNIEGWLGLGEAAPKYAEKIEYFERVLQLDPGNAAAQRLLGEARGQLAAGHILVPRRERPERVAEPQPAQPASEPAALRCYIHPAREAYVRCFQCDRPICSQCVNPTPVGQLCPECRKQRRSANYQVSWRDLLIAFPVAFLVSALIGVGVGWFVGGFLLLFLIFIGPAIAELIVRAVERTTRMKRGREMQITVSIAIVLGTLLAFLVTGNLLALLLYGVLAVTTAVARLR